MKLIRTLARVALSIRIKAAEVQLRAARRHAPATHGERLTRDEHTEHLSRNLARLRADYRCKFDEPGMRRVWRTA